MFLCVLLNENCLLREENGSQIELCAFQNATTVMDEMLRPIGYATDEQSEIFILPARNVGCFVYASKTKNEIFGQKMVLKKYSFKFIASFFSPSSLLFHFSLFFICVHFSAFFSFAFVFLLVLCFIFCYCFWWRSDVLLFLLSPSCISRQFYVPFVWSVCLQI